MTILIISVAFLARLWHLGSRSLSYDEGFSLHFSTPPLGAILTNWQEPNPPLYYSLLHFWMKLFQNSEFSIRALSVVCGLAAVWLIGWVGFQLGGRRLANMSMALLAIMPMPVEHSQIARTYSCFLALSLASYGCLLRWEASKRTRWVVAYALTTLLMCYAHYYAVFNLVAQHLYLGWQIVRKRLSMRQWACLLVPVMAGFLPWIFVMAHQLHTTGSWLPRLELPMLIYLPHFYMTRYLAPELMWVYVAVAGFGLTRLSRRTSSLLLLWLVCPLLLPFLWSQIGTPIFWPRYTVAAAAAFALLVSHGLLSFPSRAGRTLITCALVGITTTSLVSYHAQPAEAWRPLTSTLASLVQPEDALTVSDEGAQWVFNYYTRGSLAFSPLPSTVRPHEEPLIQASLQHLVAGRHRLWMAVYPEPYYPGRQINTVFAEAYPQAKLSYFKEFPGAPGAIYVFGYDLFTADAKSSAY